MLLCQESEGNGSQRQGYNYNNNPAVYIAYIFVLYFVVARAHDRRAMAEGECLYNVAS